MKLNLLLVLLLFSTAPLLAQPTHLSFDHLSVKEGLPENNVQFLQQDDLGYIWIGTQNGLVRYDGYKPKVYRFGNVLPFCTVVSMVEDSKKNLWFCTEQNGLFMYDRGKDIFKPYPYPPNIYTIVFNRADKIGNLWGYVSNTSNKAIKLARFDIQHQQFIFFDQLGVFSKSDMPRSMLWLGTRKGLYLFSNESQKFRPVPGITDTSKHIHFIYEPLSEPGILWLNIFNPVTKKGFIERLDTRTKIHADYNHLLNPGMTSSDDTVNNMYEDSRKRLWFATQNGLVLYDRKAGKFFSYLPPDRGMAVKKDHIYAIVEAKNGDLWLQCKDGILCFNPDTHQFKRFITDANSADALSNTFVYQLLTDRSGILWAVGINGVDKVNPTKSAFDTYPALIRDGSEFHYGITTDVMVAADGYLYFCNNLGIYKWKAGSHSSILVYHAKPNDAYIDALAIGKEGKIYFGNGHGLQIFDPLNQKHESYSNVPGDTTTISSNRINVIQQDHNGAIWIGTEDHGVCAYSPLTHKFRRFPYIINNMLTNSGDKLDDGTVNCIYEDRRGVIWIGTNAGGLNKFDRTTQKFKSYLFDGRRRINSVNNVFEDSKNRLWVGTFSQGLQQFDGKKGIYTTYVGEDHGLLNNAVYATCQDREGFFWVSTLAGISRVNPDNMSVKNYRLNDILPGTTEIYNNNLFSINNQLALILKNGITLFNPRDLDANPYSPEVNIEKIVYSNPASTSDSAATRSRYGIKNLELPHYQNRITFSYVALHFANAAANKYAYRLTGYDHHWIQAGTQRTATYTNLSPGTYTFRVIAANSDGVWNNTGDSVTFIINPPWWQSWWAWCLWTFLFVSAIYAFILYRSRKLLQDKKILEHKVRIRTDEVMQQKEEIVQQKEEIESQRDNLEKTLVDLQATQTQLVQSEKMASLGELTAGIAHEILNPLNFVNNFSDVNAELLLEMQEEIEKGDLAEVKALSLDIYENEKKINQHGKRADSIVKGMLEHSRTRSGQKEPTDLNVMTEEFMRLSYHGLRAKDKSFNAELVTHFDTDLPKINVIQQDMGRILLNLFNNAFYAVNQKKNTAGADYKPTVSATSSVSDGHCVISVKDNGVGIPDAIKEKIMQPFFTTKPTGEGTGLGLSLTYDMVVKGHGGTMQVNSVEGEGSEFIVKLPLT